MNRMPKLLATTMVAFAAAAPAALAQSPAAEVYNPGGGVLDVVSTPTPTPAPTTAPTTAPESGVEDQTASGTPTPTATAAPEQEAAPKQEAAPAATAAPAVETQQATTGNLPFTGFEAGFVALAGLALLAGGFAMRRATRDQA